MVERHLAKVEAAGSSPVIHSNIILKGGTTNATYKVYF